MVLSRNSFLCVWFEWASSGNAFTRLVQLFQLKNFCFSYGRNTFSVMVIWCVLCVRNSFSVVKWYGFVDALSNLIQFSTFFFYLNFPLKRTYTSFDYYEPKIILANGHVPINFSLNMEAFLILVISDMLTFKYYG